MKALRTGTIPGPIFKRSLNIHHSAFGFALPSMKMRSRVIEDEPRMLELLRKGLYERDFAVMTAVDGETGLEIATAHPFDAIVLDIGLPRLDGRSEEHTSELQSL